MSKYNNKKAKKTKKISFFNKKITTKKGSIANGVLVILALVGVFSFALVFGLQQLSPYDSTTGSIDYTCCDSGDGDLCKPSTTKVIRAYRAPAYSAYPHDYGLLKTDVHLRSTEHHIDPDPLNQRTEEGYMIFYNPMDTRQAYAHPPECPPGGELWRIEKDPIYGPPAPGETNPGCYMIPNDQLIYVCRPENDPGECEGTEGTASFDVYFRLSDYHPENPADNGIHEVIKNCVKAPVVLTPGDEDQKIINLPSPSQKQNLQLETFYITSGEPTADWISPYCKPAIYLYPEAIMPVNVKVEPVGKMLLTIPKYPLNGWDVLAYPSGDIYSAQTRYDYLFYEAAIPDNKVILPDEGFITDYQSLSSFLPDLITKLGLQGKEKDQFSEYWLKVLPESPYYQIKIVNQKVLDKISPLNIIPYPKTIIRVTLHFTPLTERISLNEPKIYTPERNGFTVVEWGGIFKRDAKHNFSCLM